MQNDITFKLQAKPYFIFPLHAWLSKHWKLVIIFAGNVHHNMQPDILPNFFTNVTSHLHRNDAQKPILKPVFSILTGIIEKLSSFVSSLDYSQTRMANF